MYNPENPRSVEKYSSAVTLSDMEIFIFPELMYSLVLANIMSPLLWQWKLNPFFRKLDEMSEYRRLLRTKQYLMDNFEFNLDLDTWGLTTKEKELARFSDFIDVSVLESSNALFGYEGDKYYFDIDIRRHFGLDKYTSDIIPYWKTETIEAMEAFKYKEGYPTGAGECVSLSTLYASALFVVAGISLDKIHLLATPLHSQNFIEVKKGVLTNNRRIVTKNMWFNGTELSAKARRALENEKVTMVVNNHGYIHTVFNEATLPFEIYRNFTRKLKRYLKIDITYETLASFLRHNSHLQKCFQVEHNCCGKPRYIEIERVFQYEHSSKFRIGDKTQNRLLHEIDEDEYYPSPIQNRVVLNEMETLFKENELAIDNPTTNEKLAELMKHTCYEVDVFIRQLINYCRTEPRLPSDKRKWVKQEPINLDQFSSSEEIIAHLDSIRKIHPIADLAFMAYRDMSRAPWIPFIKAAFERNPVCIEGTKKLDINQVAEKLFTMENESIYDTTRMAQPDEVWNYNRGDGLEKAVFLMSIIKKRHPNNRFILKGDGDNVCVSFKNKDYLFQTSKGLALPTEDDLHIS
jgi:hypothetical protein